MRRRGTSSKRLAPAARALLIAGVLVAFAAPASAKSWELPQDPDDGDLVQNEAGAKRKGRGSAQGCERRVVPPFMYNPRFMNRGFFKPLKCPENGQ